MLSQDLTFEDRRGGQVGARLDLPADGRVDGYVLLAHGLDPVGRAAEGIGRALARQGMGVLRFALGPAEAPAVSVEAILGAAALLERVAGAPPAVLVGHGLGGAAALLAARRVEGARAVAILGAPADADAAAALPGGAALFAEAGAARLEDAVAALGRPLLVMHAPEDAVVGVESAERLFAAARQPRSFVALDGADHGLSDPAAAARAAEVLAIWARRYAAGAASGPAQGQVVARNDRARYRTEIAADGFALVADEPASLGGGGAGPSPYDYLNAALGACTAMTLRMYADRKGWPLEEVAVRLGHRKIHAADCESCETKTGKIDRFEREIDLVGPLDAEQRARLLEIANKCPVHRTLESEVEVVTREAPREKR